MADKTTIDKLIDEAGSNPAHWWAQPQGLPTVNAIISTTDRLREGQKYRQDDNLVHLRLYGNNEYRSLAPEGYLQAPRDSMTDRLKYNLIASVIDTIRAKVFKNKPLPLFLTSGGDWSAQQRSKKLSKFEEGIFYENQTHKLIKDYVSLDGGVFGTGLVHSFGDGGRVKHERIFPDEITVDDYEARWTRPRNAFRTKAIHREILIARFPEAKEQIKAAPSPDMSAPGAGQGMVLVHEAWHLPDPTTLEGGRHVLCIKGVCLSKPGEEGWTRSGFPWAELRWYVRGLGYFGQGSAERLRPLQIEINKLLIKIQEILHYHAQPAWWVPRGAKFNKEQLNNGMRNVYVYDSVGGAAPTLVTPAPVPPELYQQVARLIQMGYDQEGVSVVNATGKNELGPNASGAALETYNDIQSERMILLGQSYENLVLDIARLDMEVMQELDKAGDTKDYSVRLPTKHRRMEQVDWKKVRMDTDKYLLQMFPVSSLPHTPAGRIQYIEYLKANGYITQEEAMSLMDMPDIESSSNVHLAAYRITEWMLESILEDGEYVAPEPAMNLQWARVRGQGAYLQAKMDGAPQDRLDMLLDWMNTIDQEIAKQRAAAMPPPQLGAPQPGAGGPPVAAAPTPVNPAGPMPGGPGPLLS